MPYRQKDSTNWWISYTDATGRRVRRTAGTTVYADAKAEEQKLRSASHIGKRKTGGVGIDKVLAEYLTRENRLNARNRSIGRALAAHFGGTPAADIDTAAIYGYIDQRRGDATSDSTIKRDLNLLSAAINEYNKRFGTSINNHARSIPLREPEGRTRWITQAEAQRLLDSASPLTADFIQLGLYSGMRSGEMLNLEWERVDFWRKTIRLEAQHTKAKRSRTIPLHPIALRALYRCRMRNPDSPHVFANGDSVIGSIKTGFNGACRRAGLSDFHPHDLRHTCAAWLVQAGVSLYEVRDILGHASIKQTERYAHLAQENLEGAIGRLSSL